MPSVVLAPCAIALVWLVGCGADSLAPLPEDLATDDEIDAPEQVGQPSACEIKPVVETTDLATQLAWHWSGVRHDGAPCGGPTDGDCYGNVVVTPLVADLDRVVEPALDWEDAQGQTVHFEAGRYPEVVFKAFADGSLNGPSLIVVLDGRTGETKSVLGAGHAGGHLAVGNLDDDDKLELVDARHGLAAIDPFLAPGDTEVAWESSVGSLARRFFGGAPALSDLNDDGRAEVILSGVVLDGQTGTVRADFGPANQGGGPGGGNSTTHIATVADLDLDGVPEVVLGPVAVSVSETCLWASCGADAYCADDEAGVPRCYADPSGERWSWHVLWRSSQLGSGFPAVADLFNQRAAPYHEAFDPPEVVLAAQGRVAVLDGRDGSLLWHEVSGQSADVELQVFASHGGPPAVADIDEDGRMEIAVASKTCVAVIDPDCLTMDRRDTALPGCTTLPPQSDACGGVDGSRGVRWSYAAQDYSSGMAGTTVFDFQGDGAPELVYADECFLRLFDGKDGRLLAETPNPSQTRSEFPIVADINGDGAAELLVAANNHTTGPDHKSGRNCHGEPTVLPTPAYWRDLEAYQSSAYCGAGARHEQTCRFGIRGVRAYRGPGPGWAHTRDQWHQHSYHVTEISDTGQPVPDWGGRPTSWQIGSGFRQNAAAACGDEGESLAAGPPGWHR